MSTLSSPKIDEICEDPIVEHRVVIAVTSVAGAVSGFLPWVNVPIVGSVSGTDGSDGWIVIALFAMSLILAIAGPPHLTGGRRVGIALVGSAGTIFGAWKLVTVYEMRSSAASEGGAFAEALSYAISPGIGLWVMTFAGGALMLCALFMRTASTRPAQAAAIPACVSCGAPTMWNPQHQRYFCSACRVYT